MSTCPADTETLAVCLLHVFDTHSVKSSILWGDTRCEKVRRTRAGPHPTHTHTRADPSPKPRHQTGSTSTSPSQTNQQRADAHIHSISAQTRGSPRLEHLARRARLQKRRREAWKWIQAVGYQRPPMHFGKVGDVLGYSPPINMHMHMHIVVVAPPPTATPGSSDAPLTPPVSHPPRLPHRAAAPVATPPSSPAPPLPKWYVV